MNNKNLYIFVCSFFLASQNSTAAFNTDFENANFDDNFSPKNKKIIQRFLNKNYPYRFFDEELYCVFCFLNDVVDDYYLYEDIFNENNLEKVLSEACKEYLAELE